MFALRISTLGISTWLLLLAAPFGPAHGQSVTWSVESSIVQEAGSNTDLRLLFQTSTGYFASQGASSGAVLFEGERNGDQLSGLVFAFKTGCPAESYEVMGTVAPDGKSLSLTGREPIKDAFCKVVTFRDRTLVLTRQPVVAAVPTPQPTAPPPAVAPAPPPPAPSRSYWAHNGSTLYLVASGKSRELYYDTPTPGMVAAGARNGTLLFQGVYAAGNYSGTAHIFSKKCGVLPYQVGGPVTNNFEKITLLGQKPVPDANCNITYVPDRLEFMLCVKTLPSGAVALLCPL